MEMELRLCSPQTLPGLDQDSLHCCSSRVTRTIGQYDSTLCDIVHLVEIVQNLVDGPTEARYQLTVQFERPHWRNAYLHSVPPERVESMMCRIRPDPKRPHLLVLVDKDCMTVDAKTLSDIYSSGLHIWSSSS
jgi:hypothetical protein